MAGTGSSEAASTTPSRSAIDVNSASPFVHRTITLTAAGTPSGNGAQQVTLHGYDAVGQRARTSMFDPSGISYRYDAAYRQIGIAGTAGNCTDHKLVNAGNRKRVRAASGAPVRCDRRVFDALNRVLTTETAQ
jgi:hypothetical protein